MHLFAWLSLTLPRQRDVLKNTIRLITRVDRAAMSLLRSLGRTILSHTLQAAELRVKSRPLNRALREHMVNRGLGAVSLLASVQMRPDEFTCT